jgi:hypothetical protein
VKGAAMESTSSESAALRGKIKEKCGTEKAFALQLGLTAETVSDKINGKKTWTKRDIMKAAEILGLQHDMKEFVRVFFPNIN